MTENLAGLRAMTEWLMFQHAPLVKPAGHQQTELHCNSKQKVEQLMNTLQEGALKDRDSEESREKMKSS